MARVLRVLTLLVGLAGVAVVVLAGTRTWAHVTILDMPGMKDVVLTGRDAAPAVVPVALASGAAVVVLALAGRVVRGLVALGVVALGVLVVTLTGRATDDAGGELIRTLKAGTRLFGSIGIGVPQGLDPSRTESDLTAWPWVAVAGGVLLAVSGVLALATGWFWPGPSRRFESPAGQASGVSAAPPPGTSARSDDTWDALSRGEDPT